jgi:rod shape-determining protein MreC
MALRQRPRSTRLLVVVLISLSLATITMDYRQGQSGPLAGIGRTMTSIMAPLQDAVSTVTRPIGNFFSGLAHLPSLAQENQDLKNQVAGLEAKVQGETVAQARVDELSKLLQLQQSLGATPTVAADVIASGVSNFEWTVRIDVGSAEGVTVNDAVVASGNRLVGHVISVTGGYSVVQLIIDRTSAVAGKLSIANETGLIQGEGADDMRMSLVDPAADIAPNETVVTSGYRAPDGEGGLYPSGITIGQVSRVLPESNSLQKFITVRPAVDFSSLELVLVIKSGGQG